MSTNLVKFMGLDNLQQPGVTEANESGKLYTTSCKHELINLDNLTQPGTKTYESYIGKQSYKKRFTNPIK